MRLRCIAITLLAVALPNWPAAQEQVPDSDPLRYRVDSDASWLRVLVYRGGLLRGFGHNHVISHHAIRGSLLIRRNPLLSELSLQFDVAELVVDDAEQRALAGPDFAGRVSEKDIGGTQRNMLGRKLLQAEQHPTILIRSSRITGSMPEFEVEATVLVRGREFAVVFPVTVEMTNDRIIASGELEISHGDLGLKPFRAVLGALRVRDTLILQYRVSGSRAPDANDR